MCGKSVSMQIRKSTRKERGPASFHAALINRKVPSNTTRQRCKKHSNGLVGLSEGRFFSAYGAYSAEEKSQNQQIAISAYVFE